MKQGFTLLELSIVLVIIGLVIGGITVGADMIRSAELNSVISDLNRYRVAVNTFKLKYNALPGDMKNAEAYWGTMSSGTCPNATAGNGTQTCNGNGDGRVVVGGASGQASEAFTFWQHLSSAELISGNYSGIAGSTHATHSILNENIPSSSLVGAGWYLITVNLQAPGTYFPGSYGNVLYYGVPSVNGLVTGWPYGSIIRPIEAYGIDVKSDDGSPAHGKTRVYRNLNPNCRTSQDAANAEYSLTNNDIDCAMVFLADF